MPVAGMTLMHHGHVQKDLDGQQGGDAHNEQGAEPVSGVECQPIAPDDEQGEEDDDERRADEPQLLADDGEDEVVLLLR